MSSDAPNGTGWKADHPNEASPRHGNDQPSARWSDYKTRYEAAESANRGMRGRLMDMEARLNEARGLIEKWMFLVPEAVAGELGELGLYRNSRGFLQRIAERIGVGAGDSTEDAGGGAK